MATHGDAKTKTLNSQDNKDGSNWVREEGATGPLPACPSLLRSLERDGRIQAEQTTGDDSGHLARIVSMLSNCPALAAQAAAAIDDIASHPH